MIENFNVWLPFLILIGVWIFFISRIRSQGRASAKMLEHMVAQTEMMVAQTESLAAIAKSLDRIAAALEAKAE